MMEKLLEEKTPEKIKLKDRIKNFLKDPLKFYGSFFLFFSILTLIFYFGTGPDFLKFGSFIIAVFIGIMCRQQMKTEMRMYHDR